MKKFVLWLYKVIIKHLINYHKVEAKELFCEINKLIIDEVKDLDAMTIAELRNLAKTHNISLGSKRVKQDIINIIQKHLEVK